MGICNLALFAARSGLSRCSCLSTTRSFHSLSCSCAGCLFGIAKIPFDGRVGLDAGLEPSSISGLARCSFSLLSRSFGLRLGNQRLLANLFCSAMAQLGAILPA
jgi:hypothetical protein